MRQNKRTKRKLRVKYHSIVTEVIMTSFLIGNIIERYLRIPYNYL